MFDCELEYRVQLIFTFYKFISLLKDLFIRCPFYDISTSNYFHRISAPHYSVPDIRETKLKV